MEVEISRAFAKDMRGIHRNYHRKVAQIVEELKPQTIYAKSKTSNLVRELTTLIASEWAITASAFISKMIA